MGGKTKRFPLRFNTSSLSKSGVNGINARRSKMLKRMNAYDFNKGRTSELTVLSILDAKSNSQRPVSFEVAIGRSLI